MRSRGLKLFQFIAGILLTGTAKIDASFGGAGKHFAFPAIRPSLGRPTSGTPDRLLGKLKSRRQLLEPGRIFFGSDIQSAGLTEKTADGGQGFIRFSGVMFGFWHGKPPDSSLS
jgi:hypothetical protein